MSTSSASSVPVQSLRDSLHALAFHYTAHAAKLAPHAFFPADSPVENAQSLHNQAVSAALKAFYALLSLPNTSNTIRLESHLKIAELLICHTDNFEQANQHLSQSLLLSSKVSSSVEIKLKITDMQIDLCLTNGSVKFAKKLLTESVNEAIQADSTAWRYRFMLRKAHIAFLHDNDVRAGQAALVSAIRTAHDRGDHDVEACLLLTRAHYAMGVNDTATANECLSILDAFFSPSHTGTSEELPARSELHNSLKSNRYFRLHYLLYSVILKAHIAPSKKSDENLIEIHKLADQKSSTGDVMTVGKDGWIELLVNAGKISAGPSVGNILTRRKLKVRWLSESELLVLAYLASGLARRHDSGSTKCLNFCREGYKVGNGDAYSTYGESARCGADAMSNIIASQKTMAALKAHLLLQLSRTYALRCQCLEARDAFHKLIVHLARHADLFCAFMPSLIMTHGHLSQLFGDFPTAISCFETVSNVNGNVQQKRRLAEQDRTIPKKSKMQQSGNQDAHLISLPEDIVAWNSSADPHTSILAALSLASVLLQDGTNSGKRASEILEFVSKEIENLDGSGTLRAGLCALNGIADTDKTAIEKKQFLLESLRVSSEQNNHQLQNLALTTLGDMFHLTQDKQAEKMLTASYLVANKSANHIFALLAGNLLADLYRLKNDEKKFEKQSARNAGHRKDVLKQMQVVEKLKRESINS